MSDASLRERSLDRACRHATATLHEAAGRRGALPAAIKPVDPVFRVCGPAFTVACPPGDNLWIHRALPVAPSGAVLVIEVGGPVGVEYGYWGEILSHAALARGIGGVVLDGCVRDGERLAALRFPVFARGLSIRGTVKDHAGDGALGSILRFADVEIRPGDLVVGDSDGVVVLPRAEVDEILTRADERERKEMAVIERLRKGETTLEIFDLTGSR